MKYEISTLSNGIRAAAAPLQERKSIALGIWVKVGGRDEEAPVGGISHFLEHLVFKGTKNRTANQIKESVEGIGGSLNAFTSEEYTCFLAKAASKHFDRIFDVLSDMVMNASLKESDLVKERTVIMEEIKMIQDQPSQLVEELLAELIWPEHALGRPLAGTLETVGGFTQKDLKNFKQTFYRSGLITIAAAGAIDQKTLLAAAETRFGSMENGAKEKKSTPFSNAQTKPCLKLFFKETEQTHLSFGIHALPKNHPDEYGLDLLSVILGGNMSSRLFNEVREERGLAYDISSSVRRFYDTGAFGVEAGVDNHKALEAIKVILNELDKIAQSPAKPDELERAKEFYLGQMDLALENSMNHMLWVGDSMVCLDRCKTQEEVAEKIEKVTLGDLQRVARSIFKTDSLNLALVGPHRGRFEKDLEKILLFSGA